MTPLIVINRVYQKDCTVGVLNCNSFRCLTLELPSLANTKSISCIPAGRYKCKKIISPSLGYCIEIMGVVCRTYVRIHSGNFTRQIEGCILVGDSVKDIDKDGILDVTNSKRTLKKLMATLPEEFQLLIKD